jgi:4-cresol dehydrogenase (hydroxylating) flavoprotein subunit
MPMTGPTEFSLAITRWRDLLGDRAVLLGADAQHIYGICTTGVERRIPAALRLGTAKEVPAIVAIAGEHGVPLYPISTGHNWGYGTANPVRDECVVLDLSGLDHIEMDPELGIVSLEPGVTQLQLADYLDCNELPFLVPVTGGGPNCSLVGNALERGYGITPYADHFGAVTAIEAVLPDGRKYRSALTELGGDEVDRAFKWGLGPYLDGLFAQGNLGVVTRMTIALARRPQRIEAFLFGIRDDAGLEPAVTAVKTALRTIGDVAGSINLMNARRVLAMSMPYPQGLVGSSGILSEDAVAELSRQAHITPWTGVGALYGHPAIVKAARRVLRRILGPVTRQLMFVTPGLVSGLNRVARSVPGLGQNNWVRRLGLLDASLRIVAGRPGQIALPLAYWRSGKVPPVDRDLDPARDGCGLIWYPPLVPMRPERVRRYVDLVTETCTAHQIEPLITLTSLSDRCFDSSVPLLFDLSDAAQTARAQACHRELFNRGRREGFLPYRMATHAMEWVTRSDVPYWDMVGRIKTAIDPRGIISPGRYSP